MTYKCEKCADNWSKGYCSVCGKLVCDECAKRVGYARVCFDCFEQVLDGEKDIGKLKTHLKEHGKSSKKGFKLIHTINNEEKEQNGEVYLHIGIDDVDSPYGECTTRLGAVLSEELDEFARFLDYPHLIRLNPNIPLKTRGNAGIAFHLLVENNTRLEKIKELIIGTIENTAQLNFPTTQSAVTFFHTDRSHIPRELHRIYNMALKEILHYEEIIDIIDHVSFGKVEIYSHIMNPQGGIGSTAVLGSILNDYTFELLAYRNPSLQRSKRLVSKEKLKYIDQIFSEVTFDNLDNDRILITPHGPDPVLFGIRGDFPLPLIKAFNLLEHEKIERWCLYKTNQATNVHVVNLDRLSEAKIYQTIRIPLWVTERPELMEGTVILNLTDGENNCKAFLYPPTKRLRDLGKKLGVGDLIKVTGAVLGSKKGELKINVEALTPLFILPKSKKRNPLCPKCGDRLKSKGREEYQCPSCDYRLRKKIKLTLFEKGKKIEERKRYIPPPSAHRHLTRPKKREKFSILKQEDKLKTSLFKPFCGREKPQVSQLKKQALSNYE